MARKHEHSKAEHCVSTTMFQEYISAARLVGGARLVAALCCAAAVLPYAFFIFIIFFFPRFFFFLHFNSENDLEEVLTFYTQKNKSSSVFLGTKRSVKKGFREGNASSNCENSKSESSSARALDAAACAHSLFLTVS